MRKVKLSVNDFQLFGQEVDATEIEYFQKHKDAFRRMWNDQGRKFWEHFLILFQTYTVNYGAIKHIPGKMRAYDELFLEVFDHIKADFVKGTASTAKTVVQDTFQIILHSSLVPYLESKSYSKDPFYNRDTRETYRRLFGPPEDKASYFKMYLMCSVYLKFGNSISICLRRWMQAPDQSETDESYYTPPKDDNNKDMPMLPSEVVPMEGEQEEDSDMQVFLEEKIRGNPYGPMYITDWRKGDPRFNDPSNPLFNPKADKRSDWRDSVSFGQFKEFLTYIREEKDKKNGVSASKKLQRLTRELAKDQTDVEILEKLLKAGSEAANENATKGKIKKGSRSFGNGKERDEKGPKLTLNYGPRDGAEEGPKMTVEVQFKPGDKADITIQMDRKGENELPPPGAIKALPPSPVYDTRRPEQVSKRDLLALPAPAPKVDTPPKVKVEALPKVKAETPPRVKAAAPPKGTDKAGTPPRPTDPADAAAKKTEKADVPPQKAAKAASQPTTVILPVFPNYIVEKKVADSSSADIWPKKSSASPTKEASPRANVTENNNTQKSAKEATRKILIVREDICAACAACKTGSTQTSGISNGVELEPQGDTRGQQDQGTDVDEVLESCNLNNKAEKGTSPMIDYGDINSAAGIELKSPKKNSKRRKKPSEDEIDEEKNEAMDGRAKMFQMMWDLTIANMQGSPLNLLPNRPPMFQIPSQDEGNGMRQYLIEFNHDYELAYKEVKDMDAHMAGLRDLVMKEARSRPRNDAYFVKRGRLYRILRAMHRRTNKKMNLFNKAIEIMLREFNKLKTYVKDKKKPITEGKFSVHPQLLDLVIQSRQQFRMARMVAAEISEEILFLKYETGRQMGCPIRTGKGVPDPADLYGFFLSDKYRHLTDLGGAGDPSNKVFRPKLDTNNLWKDLEYPSKATKGEWVAMLRVSVDTEFTAHVTKSIENITHNHSRVHEVVAADEERDPEPDLDIASWESSLQNEATDIAEEEIYNPEEDVKEEIEDKRPRSKEELALERDNPLCSLMMDKMSQAMKKGGSLSYKDPPKIQVDLSWYKIVYRVCAHCTKQEPHARAWKKCLKCQEEKIEFPRYYCCKDCQTEDWNYRHKLEHKTNKLRSEKRLVMW